MKIKVSGQIKADNDKVFQAFTDLSNLEHNVEAIKGIEILTDGEIGIGTKFKETRVMFGQESSETMEITEYRPFEYFREEAKSGGMHYVTEWRFDGNENETMVSITFSATPTTFSARLMNLVFILLAGSMKKAFLKDMADLRKVLEK